MEEKKEKTHLMAFRIPEGLKQKMEHWGSDEKNNTDLVIEALELYFSRDPFTESILNSIKRIYELQESLFWDLEYRFGDSEFLGANGEPDIDKEKYEKIFIGIQESTEELARHYKNIESTFPFLKVEIKDWTQVKAQYSGHVFPIRPEIRDQILAKRNKK